MTNGVIFEKVAKFLKIANRKEMESAEKYGRIADVKPEEMEALGWVSEYNPFVRVKAVKN